MCCHSDNSLPFRFDINIVCELLLYVKSSVCDDDKSTLNHPPWETLQALVSCLCMFHLCSGCASLR